MDRQSIINHAEQREYSAIVRRSGKGRRSLSFLQALVLVILCPCFIASLQDVIFFSSGYADVSAIQSSRSAIFFGGVNAMAVPRDESAEEDTPSTIPRKSIKRNHSYHRQQSVFGVKQEQTTEESTSVGGSNTTTNSTSHQHNQVQQSVEVVGVPSKRWGHSVTYLKNSNVALFVGGQVASKNNSMVMTNEVFAMDLSANATQPWAQLSSENLEPHAFAARAHTHDDEGSDERVFIVGGATADCSSNSSQVFMWKAGSSWKDGQWSVPTFSNDSVVPERRRGARALQVPVQVGMINSSDARQAVKDGGISFMLIGGKSDETTCSNVSSTYTNASVWTMGAGASTGRRTRLTDASSTFETRTLAMNSGKTNMSIVDYSSVYLPANGTQGDRVLMIGGMDQDDKLTSFHQLWVLDLASGNWSRMQTTNSTSNGHDVPHGRVGHTATRTDNGTVIIYGGYTSLAHDRVPTMDVHVLDYTVDPAVWTRVNSSYVPSRAYHTAFMAGDVMVVGFGQGDYNSTSSSKNVSTDALQKRKSSTTTNSTSQAIQFLDTANADGWTWSDSMSAVLARRAQSSATATSSASSSTSSSVSSATSSSSAVTVASKSTAASMSTSASATSSHNSKTSVASSSVASSTVVADSTSTASSAESTSPSSSSATSTDTESVSSASPTTTTVSLGGTSPAVKRDTTIVGSILGAAASLAAIGGLYAAHKRRQTRLNGDDDSMNGDKYERFSSAAPGPPVSSLWLHQLKRRATLASLMNRSRSARKRGSPNSASVSAGASPKSFLGNYSTPVQGSSYNVMRNVPRTSRFSIRRDQMTQSQEGGAASFSQNDLPDAFLRSILDDDEIRARNDMRRTVGGSLTVPPPAAPPMNRRALSSDSLESDGGASHFSYPYLQAMHRSDNSNGMSSNNSSPVSLAQETLPRYALQDGQQADYSNDYLVTPSWSQMEEPMEEKRASFDTVDFASDEDDIQRDSISPSAMVATTHGSSPLFPWETQPSWGTPVFPSKVCLDQSQRRSQQTPLRVINDSDY